MGCSSGKQSLPQQKPTSGATLLSTGPHGKEVPKEVAREPPATELCLEKKFDGTWKIKGTDTRFKPAIRGSVLERADGTIAPIRIDEALATIEVAFDGLSFFGELRKGDSCTVIAGRQVQLKEDSILWSDGEIWERHVTCKAFYEQEGCKALGPDLLVEKMTLEDAKRKAATMENCKAITYEGGSSDLPKKMHFKGIWEVEKTVESIRNWTAFRVVEEPCAAADPVKAVFPLTNKLYTAHIASVGAGSTVTVNWLDGGKTHRILPSTKVFKDYADASNAQSQTAGLPPISKGSVADAVLEARAKRFGKSEGKPVSSELPQKLSLSAASSGQVPDRSLAPRGGAQSSALAPMRKDSKDSGNGASSSKSSQPRKDRGFSRSWDCCC